MPGRLPAGLRRLRNGWLGVAEATVAASLAWELDSRLLHHRQAFFAPAAALIVLGQARGLRIRRAVEVLLGVSGGIFVADLVARALGPHNTVTVVVVIASTLLLAVLVGAGPVLVVQAAVSAVYVAVVTPPGSGGVTNRLVDALVGGGVALALSQLNTVRDPLRPLVEQIDATLGELRGIFDDIADAVGAHDEDRVRAALARARSADAQVGKLRDAVLAAEEGLWLRVRRRERVAGVRDIEQSVQQVDFAVRGSRVLARGSATLVRLERDIPADLAAAIRALGTLTEAARTAMVAGVRAEPSQIRPAVEASREAAYDAARAAAAAIAANQSVPLVMLVGQVRLTALDLLRAGGADDVMVAERLDTILGLAVSG